VLTNALCALLRIDVPVIQGPLASASSPELVAAVGDAGGLGMLAFSWLSDDQARAQVHGVRRLSGRPFGVNLVLDFPVDSKGSQINNTMV
jgi:NAD(P)H-dependent flavin oxidoreductase YrpB (nitropropane dioxygenase family)